MALLPVEEALARILSDVAPTGREDVPITEAAGRTLAAPLAATLTQPPFNASAMDGYAVRSADVATLPARLKVLGQSAAGHGYHGPVGPGEAVRIFTGAPVPEGADAVVIQENTTRDGDIVTVTEGTPDGAHIRKKGFDFAAGQVLLEPGTLLGVRQITLAAAMGHGLTPVRRRPTVAILATGDELVTPGTPPGPDQIVCSNSYGIAAMLRAAGADPRILGIARDTREDLAAKLALAEGADVLVTIGGASVGDHDLVAPALQARGLSLDFWKIAMRPGKPLMFGRLGRQRVLGLPGNPVSSLICTRVFIVPLVERLLARPPAPPVAMRARLTHPLPANAIRQHYMRAILEPATDGGLPRVSTIRSQDSSLLSPLAQSNGLIVRPPNAPALAADTEISVLPLDF